MTSSPTRRIGFTLAELLVSIVIIMILAGLTLGSLRASRTHQVMEQAASRVGMTLESAKALAAAEGESVFLGVADHGSEPEGAGLRGVVLLRLEEGGEAEMVREWRVLPRGVFFAPDPWESEGDLVGEWSGLEALVDPFGEEPGFSEIRGRVRLLVEVRPDGRFYSGSEFRAQPAHVLLRRGEWYRDTSGDWQFQGTEPADAVRVKLRALSGITRMERVTP